MSCPVCIEPMNKSNRKSIDCVFCEYVACKDCYKRYLLDKKSSAHCMSCSKEWDLKIMIQKFDKSFLDKDYKKHREDVLIEKEKGLMVTTQPVVERLIIVEKIQAEIKELKKAKNANDMRIYDLTIKLKQNQNTVEVDRKKFIRKCTFDDCKGFLSSQWKCGLCEHRACSHCHELLSDIEHTCNKDTLETIKLLNRDTKNCPTCAVDIFKIEGCDQMFCTECHTPFSWKTGKIETGVIHNPHYFAYRREMGTLERNPLDVICGREIDNLFEYRLLNKITSVTNRNLTRASLRYIIHLSLVELPRYKRKTDIDINEDLRIDYMRNKISEVEFKKKLQIREKKISKTHEINNVLTMFISCQTDLFYRLYENVGDWDAISKESNILLSYVNDCLSSITNLYTKTKGVGLHLDESFRLTILKK